MLSLLGVAYNLLQYLSLRHTNLDTKTATALAEYVASSPKLKNLHLHCPIAESHDIINVFESIAKSKSLEILDIKVSLAMDCVDAFYGLIANTESIMCIYADFTHQTYFTLDETIFDVLGRNKSLVSLVFKDHRREVHLEALESYLAESRLNTIWFQGLKLIVPGGEMPPDHLRERLSRIYNDSMIDCLWISINRPIFAESFERKDQSAAVLRRLESYRLVKYARLLLSMRPSADQKTQLPREILIIIFIRFSLTKELWPREWLTTITRCLLDHRSIGKIHHELIPFSQQALHSICKRLLK